MTSHQKKYDILGVKNSMVYQNKKFACKIEKKMMVTKYQQLRISSDPG